MNGFAIIILTAMFTDALLGYIADILNLRQLKTELPPAFNGWYDADRYAASQRYLKVNTRFGWLVSAFDLCVILLFWFYRGFFYLDQWVRGFDWSPVAEGIVFISVLILLKSIISIPFDLYSTFVIEERFGFNKTTIGTYLKDKFKVLLLSILLGGPLLAAVLVFFQYTGTNAWWYCWLAAVVFMLIVHYIAPAWIMPLFNRFEPLPAGQLRDAITSYAKSIDFALDNIFVMDGSKRSTKSNAFFTGFGRHRRIVLFDTLIEKHSTQELVAVLAHEMGHYKERHILKMLSMGIIQAGLMFYILSFFISHPGLANAFFVEEVSVYAGLIFFGMLYAPVEGFIGIVIQVISRKHEFDADRFAAKTTSNPMEMITALKKLAVHNLSNLLPHPLYVFLHYSHPPVLQRIEAIEQTALANKCQAS